MSEVSYNRFKRGQIWKVYKDKLEAKKGMQDKGNHLMEKTRTWLIVSIDDSNDNAPILNCVSMSSNLRPLPPHVRVRMDNCDCNVQCEHIMTMNKSDFDGADYIGVLEDKSMRKVEIALANQLGLSIQIPSIEVLQDFIERLVESKAKELKERSKQVTDDVVIDLASKLEDILDIPKTSVKKEENKVVNRYKIEDSNVQSDNNVGSEGTKESKQGRRKWDDESIREFLKDADTLSSRDMCKKYNMTMKTVYSTKYRLKNMVS